MKVQVKLAGPLKRRFDGVAIKMIEIPEDAEVRDLLKKIGFPETGYMTAVNGMRAFPDKKLKDGDKVAIFPPTTGG
jgi:sulfur carrier protein ThiS